MVKFKFKRLNKGFVLISLRYVDCTICVKIFNLMFSFTFTQKEVDPLIVSYLAPKQQEARKKKTKLVVKPKRR